MDPVGPTTRDGVELSPGGFAAFTEAKVRGPVQVLY
jgi:hypothetical protein